MSSQTIPHAAKRIGEVHYGGIGVRRRRRAAQALDAAAKWAWTMVYAVKRVYEPPDSEDGLRVLVDRLWPRGIAKAAARIDLWIRDIAPSDALRKWYGHEPKHWAEFRRRYAAELRGHRAAMQPLIEAAKTQRVTLLFSSRETKLNNAFALKAMLERAARPRKRAPSGTRHRPVASRGA